jgi:hypothetical protein
MNLRKIFTGIGIMSLSVAMVNATPSTQIWNPSTDIQKTKTMHLGIDNYFNDQTNSTAQVNSYYLGLTYGLFKNMEIGVDLNEASKAPMLFNAKYGIAEGEIMPAIAGGIMNYGTVENTNDYNIGYAVIAKTFGPIGRFSVGGYSGNPALMKNNAGETDNSGLIASWDKSLTQKIWASVDYSSGESSYGTLSGGVSYAFSDNVSVIFGAVIYNNGLPTQATTQLDINL